MSLPISMSQPTPVQTRSRARRFRDVLAQIRTLALHSIGATVLALICLLTLLAPLLAPAAPNDIETRSILLPPSRSHPLGTDQLGRDTFSRVLYGGRSSLFFAAVSASAIVLIGIAVGSMAGYLGGYVDLIASGVINALLALPSLLLTLAILGVLGTGSVGLLVALIGGGWAGQARIFRAEVLALREQPFIDAARASGASPARILLRHLGPNILPTAVVLVTLDFGALLLVVSSLSFLGLGVQPPTADWGAMLSDARPYLGQAPWLAIAPGLCITVAVLASNLAGDMVRERVLRR